MKWNWWKVSLKDRVKKSLQEKSPQTIPSLIKNLDGVTNEFAVMRAVGELQHTNEVILTGWEIIYREDGGAIHLAEYSIWIGTEKERRKNGSRITN